MTAPMTPRDRAAMDELLASIKKLMDAPEPQMIPLWAVIETWCDRTWNEAIEAAAIEGRDAQSNHQDVETAIRALKRPEAP